MHRWSSFYRQRSTTSFYVCVYVCMYANLERIKEIYVVFLPLPLDRGPFSPLQRDVPALNASDRRKNDRNITNGEIAVHAKHF